MRIAGICHSLHNITPTQLALTGLSCLTLASGGLALYQRKQKIKQWAVRRFAIPSLLHSAAKRLRRPLRRRSLPSPLPLYIAAAGLGALTTMALWHRAKS